MVSTRKGLDTSLVDPKNLVRPQKIPKPVNIARSADVSIYEFPDDDTSTVVDQSAKDSGATISSDTVAQSFQDPPGLLEPNHDEARSMNFFQWWTRTATPKTQTHKWLTLLKLSTE
jgi:hypothetical protein